jgi:transcriptional regulator with XRE-family HTH domain
MQTELDKRAKLFAEYVGSELKGLIASHGYSQGKIADAIGHARPSLSNWLNNKPSIPIEVAQKICEYLDAELQTIVARAYDRVEKELGPYQDNHPAAIEQARIADHEARIARTKEHLASGMALAAYQDPDKERGMDPYYGSED